MADEQLNEINKKLDALMSRGPARTSSTLNFLFTAGMPVIIAIIGIVFTFMNNRRQIEFQQIQVADKMVADVQTDMDFNKEKLDLKLLFVESMFQDQRFKHRVKDLLSQTYAVTLQEQTSELTALAQSGDAEDVKYVQNKIAEAKKFGDTSINNVVKQLEQKPAIRNITKPNPAKPDTTETKESKKDSVGVKKPIKTISKDSVKTTSPKKPGQTKDQGKGKKNNKKKPGE